jgi:phosphatidylglycerophosphatase A
VKGLVKVLASGLGTGFSPLAPGTMGSLLGAVIYWYAMPDHLDFRGWALYLLLVILAFFLGVFVSGRAEAFWGHDAHRIVIDEVVGMWVTMAFLPTNHGFAQALGLLTAGFLLFRAFDIWKPFPIRSTERLPGGWGVMVDDQLAGIYANLVLQLGWYLYQTLSL